MTRTKLLVSLLLAMAASASFAEISIDPSVYFAYAQNPSRTKVFALSHQNCAFKGAAEQWKAGVVYLIGAYQPKRPTCWAPISGKPDQIEICPFGVRPDGSNTTDLCQPALKSLFIDTQSLPSRAKF